MVVTSNVSTSASQQRARLSVHGHGGVLGQMRDRHQLAHVGRVVAGQHPEGIARLVGDARTGERELEVNRLLRRAPTVEGDALQDRRDKRIGFVVNRLDLRRREDGRLRNRHRRHRIRVAVGRRIVAVRGRGLPLGLLQVLEGLQHLPLPRLRRRLELDVAVDPRQDVARPPARPGGDRNRRPPGRSWRSCSPPAPTRRNEAPPGAAPVCRRESGGARPPSPVGHLRPGCWKSGPDSAPCAAGSSRSPRCRSAPRGCRPRRPPPRGVWRPWPRCRSARHIAR